MEESSQAILLEALLKELQELRGENPALALLIERAVALPGSDPPPPKEDPTICPNCGTTVTSDASPYCGISCREQAAFVRQLRRCLADGSIRDRERQTSLGQVLWHLLGGGYPLRQRLVTPRTWQQLLKRDGGVCQVCGVPATTFDHITTACNRPINLRAVCDECTQTKQFGDSAFLKAQDAALSRLAVRIAAPEPLLLSDDPAHWDWRTYVAKRKKARL